MLISRFLRIFIQFMIFNLTPPSYFTFGKSVKIGAIFEEKELKGKVYKAFKITWKEERFDNLYNFSSAHVQSICDAMDITHVETHDVESSRRIKSLNSEFSFNVRPKLSDINRAFTDVITANGWTKVGLVYGNSSALYEHGLGPAFSVARMQNALLIKGVESVARTFTSVRSEEIILELKQNDFKNILLDLSSDELSRFFSACREVGLSKDEHNFLLIPLDFRVDRLFARSFTFFRILDQHNPVAKELALDVSPDGELDLNSAIVYDALYSVARAAQSLNNALSSVSSISCTKEKAWNSGATFFNYLNSVTNEGLTGKLKFRGGERYSLNLQVHRYLPKSQTSVQLGSWDGDEGLVLFNKSVKAPRVEEPRAEDPSFGEEGDEEDERETLIVVTKEERPYVMFREGRTGVDAYDGFAIDLIKAISDVIGFNFRLYAVPDNLYGFYNRETGEWNGIVRQLIDKRADLAVASMTINYARETVIDFTKPFMNLGISILFKAPKPQPTELFSFMNPLALEIWLYILLAYILVSLTIWIVARFSPYEWAYPHPCEDRNRLFFQNDFTLPNSFWFAIGTLMQQGSDLNPKAASTRIVGGMWWFFTLIIISSYTANLAAFLTVERMATPIESADDLAEQNDIAYGTLVGGSTMTFFRDSKVGKYQKMWRYMESKDDGESFVHSYETGVEKVLRGNYAFLGESTMLDYLIQRNCNLTQIGGLIDSKGYGIATPKGSKWRDKISQAILYLQEKGVIQMYYDKWWKNHGLNKVDSEACAKKTRAVDSVKANALGVVNIGGIFVVLLCGLAFAVTVAILEFCLSDSSSEDKKSNFIDIFFSKPELDTQKRPKKEGKTDCSQCILIQGEKP